MHDLAVDDLFVGCKTRHYCFSISSRDYYVLLWRVRTGTGIRDFNGDGRSFGMLFQDSPGTSGLNLGIFEASLGAVIGRVSESVW